MLYMSHIYQGCEELEVGPLEQLDEFPSKLIMGQTTSAISREATLLQCFWLREALQYSDRPPATLEISS